MKISYLVFTHNETGTLSTLLNRLINLKNDNDEIIVSDDYSTDNHTLGILDDVKDQITLVKYKLENGYSDKKNKALSHCTGDYIFAIDGDELPTETLLINLKDIICQNSDVELFWVGRINDFKGVTPSQANTWGWVLSPSTSITHNKIIYTNSEEYHFLVNNGYIINEIGLEVGSLITYKAVLVNAYDPQGRIFKNCPSRIKWEGKLHERIVGNKDYVFFPMDEELMLHHLKSIEHQIETNLRYNRDFSIKDNQGFNLPK